MNPFITTFQLNKTVLLRINFTPMFALGITALHTCWNFWSLWFFSLNHIPHFLLILMLLLLKHLLLINLLLLLLVLLILLLLLLLNLFGFFSFNISFSFLKNVLLNQFFLIFNNFVLIHKLLIQRFYFKSLTVFLSF